MDLLLIFPGFILAFIIVLYYERKIKLFRTASRNRAHFYVARDKDKTLYLYLGKPVRDYDEFHGYSSIGSIPLTYYHFNKFGLNKDDYANLKWEDEPLEVFVNMED